MAINQKRIYELGTYTQLESGDPGFIPATAVYLAVDYNGWTEAKKMPLDGFLGTLHIEAGKLTSLGDRSVSVVFDTAFTGTIIDRVVVYREVEIIAGETVRKEVNLHDLAVTLSGFTLEIDDGESLTGIVIDYSMIEAQ
jgi:hypothetical protein